MDQAPSAKLQAPRPALMMPQLKRIADAIEEILRLVKKDMEKYEKKNNNN